MANPCEDVPLHEIRNGLHICNVERLRTDFLLTMLGDKCVEAVLTTANGGDFYAFLDQAIGHAMANARGGTNHEDMLESKRGHGSVFRVAQYAQRS